MKVTAAHVKELRERTGAGMMDCRKALIESECDLELAIEVLRKAGAAKAAKKSGRVAAEGLVDAVITADGTAVLVEVNCETDFVARNESFRSFVDTIKSTVANEGVDGVADKVNVARTELVATIGENIKVRRAERFDSDSANFAYVHPGNRIAVILQLQGGNDSDEVSKFGKDLCFHIAAMNPLCTSQNDVPSDVIEQERRIAREQLTAEGKPEGMIEKIIPGKLKRFYKDRCLLDQEAAMGDDGVTNQALLDALMKSIDTPVTVTGFMRYELGEGIEKKVDNLAAEVAAMTGGA
ncbi:MAG: translation elongation factor Ts [Myxococcota bacterium]|nr:translation elongation factor Ts [Myxococcota bacterium]